MFIVLFILLLSFSSQAADIGLSARALGMGNAYTAVVDNGDAIFYNPAGLAKMGGFNWTIIDPGGYHLITKSNAKIAFYWLSVHFLTFKYLST